jgi:hypothetical protein
MTGNPLVVVSLNDAILDCLELDDDPTMKKIVLCKMAIGDAMLLNAVEHNSATSGPSGGTYYGIYPGTNNTSSMISAVVSNNQASPQLTLQHRRPQMGVLVAGSDLSQ